MEHRPKIVILGGGFGGLGAAQALKHADADITLLDRRNFHLFQPLLYQVATGSLSPGQIASPIRGVLSRQKNTRVLLGEVSDIDPQTKRLTLMDDGVLDYDDLIVATGSQSSYFGHDEWSELAPNLKSVEEATRIRHKLLFAFEEAERITDPDQRRAWLTFVIVGGGATGVELSGAFAEVARETLKNDFRSIRPQYAKIMLVDGGDRILSTYSEKLSQKAAESLTKLGVEIRTGVMVSGVASGGVVLKTKSGAEERVDSKTVIWAAGVTVSKFGKLLAQKTGAETAKSGKIKVAPDLTIPKFPNIYVVGDLAAANGDDGKPLPGVAQVAMQGGAYAAKTIMKRAQGESAIKAFHYFNKGDLAVIGRGSAVANVFGVQLSGLLAWLVWLFIHLLYIVQFQSRVLVFVEWGFLYLTNSRSARLITGPPETE